MYGKRAHAMEPRDGINAILRLIEFLDTILEDKFISFIKHNFICSRLNTINENFTDSEMGDLTSNVAILNIKNNNILCELPTGTGKSFMALNKIKQLKPKSILI